LAWLSEGLEKEGEQKKKNFRRANAVRPPFKFW